MRKEDLYEFPENHGRNIVMKFIKRKQALVVIDECVQLLEDSSSSCFNMFKQNCPLAVDIFA